MKRTVLFLLLTLAISGSYAQGFPRNDSIKYTIIRVTRGISTDNSLNKSGLFVKVDIDSVQQKLLLCKSTAYWVDKLSGVETDWAANLMLYFLHARDAAVLLLVQDHKITFASIKQSEIRYWKSYLSSLKNAKGCPE